MQSNCENVCSINNDDKSCCNTKVKTPLTVKVNVDIDMDMCVKKHHLDKVVQHYSFSLSSLESVIVEIVNPRNSGKTIKIDEVLVYSPVPISGLTTGLVYFYKNNGSNSGFTEIDGGYNLNFGCSDNHVAKFYTTHQLEGDYSLLCTGPMRLNQEKFIFDGNIIIPPSCEKDQKLLIDISTMSYGANMKSNITILWTEV